MAPKGVEAVAPTSLSCVIMDNKALSAAEVRQEQHTQHTARSAQTFTEEGLVRIATNNCHTRQAARVDVGSRSGWFYTLQPLDHASLGGTLVPTSSHQGLVTGTTRQLLLCTAHRRF